MAELKLILEKESSRPLDEINRIDLYREGTFWRAYEWSAWLFSKFVRQFQITKRNIKGTDGTYVLLGFPEKTLERLDKDSFITESCSEKECSFSVQYDVVSEELQGQEWNVVLSEWKKLFPIKENTNSKSLKDQHANPMSSDKSVNSLSMMLVAQKILSYPIESSTPIDNLRFIGELKRDVSSFVM